MTVHQPGPSDDEILNSKDSNEDLWGDADEAEFFNENSSRIIHNQAPISAAQRDKDAAKSK